MDIKQQINILYLIAREKAAAQMSINAICLSTIKSPAFDTEIRCATGNTSNTETYALRITELNELIKDLDALEESCKKDIEKYLNNIDDSILREILRGKYISKLTWKSIGSVGNTKDSARKLCNRFFAKHIEDEIISKANCRRFDELKDNLKELAAV